MTKAPRNACRQVGLATVLFVTVAAQAAHAQRLRGRLLDLASDEPIPARIVTLLSNEGTAILNGVSDRDGYWTLDAPAPGSYYVAAARIGYQRWVSGPVAPQPGDDWNSTFRLRRLPVMLEPVVVSARATRRYLDRAVELRGSDLSRGGTCRPRVFVDGLMYIQGDSRPRREDDDLATEARFQNLMQPMDQAVSLDDIGHPSTIAAIEIYRSATQVPVQFGGASVETLCGVIVIWTRTGRLTTDRR